MTLSKNNYYHNRYALYNGAWDWHIYSVCNRCELSYLNLDSITHKLEYQEIISLELKGDSSFSFRSPGHPDYLFIYVIVRCRA